MTFILGCGNIGSLIATSLKKVSRSEITLIFQNQKRLEQFVKNESTITMKYSNINQIESTQFPAMTYSSLRKSYNQRLRSLNKTIDQFIGNQPPQHPEQISESSFPVDEGKRFIDNLIITTKAQDTYNSLLPLFPLINDQTNLVFIQNGAGVVEQIYKSYFAKLPPNQRPANIFQGIINHGVYRLDNKNFEFTHTSRGKGELKLGKYTDPNGSEIDKSTELPEIISDLAKTDLHVSYSPNPLDFQLVYFEKLIVNAIVNPLTTLFECRNGELLEMSRIRPLMTKLLKEDIKFLYLNYFNEKNYSASDLQIIQNTIDEERLMNIILKVIKLTANNYSSMLQDYKLNKKSFEINYLNGFFVRSDTSNTPYNKMLVDMIQNKQDMRDYKQSNISL
ncbi:2-dehydropantoate 2-reductase [Saccharomycopsis crataegensis]|uniref:2-dehydropantoate 2-reductase n=1 Tax=Saccharomycopsis crataegensis TaxID=43959 RepID=A0AAV5QPR4_9ASCO|nr:2-dehydropantoate 2-reductase [Saccharomycopsis crataegensis]